MPVFVRVIAALSSLGLIGWGLYAIDDVSDARWLSILGAAWLLLLVATRWLLRWPEGYGRGKPLVRLVGRVDDDNVHEGPAYNRDLAEAGYEPEFGARPLKRAIQREIMDPLARDLLSGKFAEGATIRIDARNGELVFK